VVVATGVPTLLLDEHPDARSASDSKIAGKPRSHRRITALSRSIPPLIAENTRYPWDL
jgi:hypothetical protein